MNKLLVIGDIHLDNRYPGYLQAQRNTLLKLVGLESPTHIILLGDVFHFRKPDPTVLLTLNDILTSLVKNHTLQGIYILRGNHDSINKSDDTRTALEVYENIDKVKVVTIPYFDNQINLYFIPHYEDSDKIIDYLQSSKHIKTSKPYLRKDGPLVFGHFGYSGCLNSIGAQDFTIDISKFPDKTILGHIHKFREEGKITVLGTPWSTSFSECDYKHYYAVLTGDGLDDYKIEYKEINFGLRHYSIQYEALEANKEEISDSNYETILRVLISKFDPNGILSNPADIRKKILKEYGVLYVDLKFQPIVTDKYSRQSNFVPGTDLSEINDTVINQYIEENKSNIPNEDLIKVLNDIKEYSN